VRVDVTFFESTSSSSLGQSLSLDLISSGEGESSLSSPTIPLPLTFSPTPPIPLASLPNPPLQAFR
jgi:hypothetical protein